ncbi:MAG: hypothetical protein NVS3B17_08420 [Vulcanimicrobiaceae bacterium]
MATSPEAATVPPVEVVLSEVVANLSLIAHAYLHPTSEGVETEPDLDDAEIAIDVAGTAFDRISSRLPAEQRSAIARMLTELRMSYVKKRGL